MVRYLGKINISPILIGLILIIVGFIGGLSFRDEARYFSIFIFIMGIILIISYVQSFSKVYKYGR